MHVVMAFLNGKLGDEISKQQPERLRVMSLGKIKEIYLQVKVLELGS